MVTPHTVDHPMNPHPHPAREPVRDAQARRDAASTSASYPHHAGQPSLQMGSAFAGPRVLAADAYRLL